MHRPNCRITVCCLDSTTPDVHRDSVPSSPNNVSVRWQGNSLLISWFPPPARRSSATVGCYLVQYRTLGHWVPLAERVAASERPTYRWTTASRSVTYQFRVFSIAAPCRPDLQPILSRPSTVVSFHTSGLVLHTTVPTQSAVYGVSSVCLPVCLFVTLRYRDHTGWNTSKIISWLIRRGFLLSASLSLVFGIESRAIKFVSIIFFSHFQ